MSARGEGRLYLLDGTLLFFRALHGTPDVFSDVRGRAVNGVRGYLGYLLKLLETDRVGYCVAAFDQSLNSCWRNDVYPAYKANRPAADANVLHQLDCCRQLTEALGIPVLADPNYEADDFIATLARKSRREVVVVSRDKDLRQLLDGSVSLLDPGSGAVTGPAEFRAEFGFAPVLFPDYQALTGDAVDNVPGVRGIGPKTAQRLVAAFGALEAIHESVGRWPEAGVKPGSAQAARLLEQREEAFLFRRVLRLDPEVPLPLSLSATRLARPDRAGVLAVLAGLGLEEGLGSAAGRALERYCV